MNYIVEHLGIAAKDSRRLRDWYVRVLSARVIFENNEEPPAFLLEMSGGTVIEIYPSHSAIDDIQNNRLAGWRHLALQVESIESAAEDLRRNGVVIEEPIKAAGGGGRVLFFKDDEGNLLHLVERPPGSPFKRKLAQ